MGMIKRPSSGQFTTAMKERAGEACEWPRQMALCISEDITSSLVSVEHWETWKRKDIKHAGNQMNSKCLQSQGDNTERKVSAVFY